MRDVIPGLLAHALGMCRSSRFVVLSDSYALGCVGTDVVLYVHAHRADAAALATLPCGSLQLLQSDVALTETTECAGDAAPKQ